jgi:hypothetical protein
MQGESENNFSLARKINYSYIYAMKDKERKFAPLITALRARLSAEDYAALNEMRPWRDVRRAKVGSSYHPTDTLLELCRRAKIRIENCYVEPLNKTK